MWCQIFVPYVKLSQFVYPRVSSIFRRTSEKLAQYGSCLFLWFSSVVYWCTEMMNTNFQVCAQSVFAPVDDSSIFVVHILCLSWSVRLQIFVCPVLAGFSFWCPDFWLSSFWSQILLFQLTFVDSYRCYSDWQINCLCKYSTCVWHEQTCTQVCQYQDLGVTLKSSPTYIFFVLFSLKLRVTQNIDRDQIWKLYRV